MVLQIGEDPVVTEVAVTLIEWHQICLSLYLDDNYELFKRLGDLLIELADNREELVVLLNRKLETEDLYDQAPYDSSRYATNKSQDVGEAQQIIELKTEIIDKLDLGNQILSLDLVLRDTNFRPVDPIILSPIRLYELHAVKSSNSDQFYPANGQQCLQECQSVAGSTYYGSASQTGSEITTISSSSSLYTKHALKPIYHHLQFCLDHCSLAWLPSDEKFEAYFSVVEIITASSSPSSCQINPLSEKFLIQIQNESIIDGHFRTVFANIGPIKGRELGILVQVYRVGKMLLSETNKTNAFSKQQSTSNLIEGSTTSINTAAYSKYSSNGFTRSRHSTIGAGLFIGQPNYKRPFGLSFVPLATGSSCNHLSSKEFQMNTRVYLTQNEADFSQSGDLIFPNKKNQFRATNATQPYIQMDFKFKVLSCKQESIDRVSSFNPSEYCLTEKRGYPDIVMPGDFKNDIYLNLESAEFEKGGKSIPKNIEASISLIDRSGLTIESCIVPASNCDKVSTYKSCIFYHSNSPRWNEHIKINVPLTEFDKSHIRIEFRHCSTKDREKKFLGFCFLPLSDDDGTVIPDKTHELYLYKCDSQLWEDDTLNLNLYSSLPHGPDAIKSSGSSASNQSSTLSGATQSLGSNNNLPINNANLMRTSNQNSRFTHSSKEIVTVSTFLLSTKLTQNSTLLNLLRWRELIKRNNKDFEETLKKVLTLKGEEIVKFLQDVLDTLFDTFTLSLSREDDNSSLIFKVLVHIFLLLEESKYQHFKPVLDTYVSAHFSATLVYKGLLACVIECVKKSLESSSIIEWQAPIQKCFRTSKYVFQFIVQSKILYSLATGDSSVDEHFLMDLRRLFKLFESLLSNTDKKLMLLQETFLESFAGAIEQLSRVMDSLELAKVVTSLVSSVGLRSPPPLSKSKLIFMREIACGPLVKKQESRMLISETFCRHLDIYFCNFERLELCHDVLDALLLRVHDVHWPTIQQLYRAMLRAGGGNDGPSSADQQEIVSANVATVGEINSNRSRYSTIQANQLDLALSEVSRELNPFIKPLRAIPQLLNRLMRDLNSDRPIIQRYCTCLLTLYKLMDKDNLQLFLQRSLDFPSLGELFKSMRAVFNRDWFIMQLTSHAILENHIDEISRESCLEIASKSPDSYINLMVDFITHPTLQLETFSKRKMLYITQVFGDLRLKLTKQLIRFWNSLNKQIYSELVPTSVQPFLDACLLPSDELQSRLLGVFYDMIDAEECTKGDLGRFERCMIDKLDLFFTLERGDSRFIENFERILKSRIKEESPGWESDGQRLIDSFAKLVRLLLDYRNALDSYENRSRQMVCLVELLNFYRDLGRMDIYLRYLFKLCDILLDANYYTEAGFTLKMYADELRWCSTELPALEGLKPEPEWRRKENLYQRIIQYFKLGRCWEESMGLCKELASFYENFLVDYEKLSSTLKNLTELLDCILNEYRAEREYFRVEYFGSEMPDYIRCKEFIYRGGECERLPDFMHRISAEFPDAKLLASKDSKDMKDKSSASGQYMVITSVKPMPFLQETFKVGQRNVNEKILQYYLNNRLDTFSYDMPIIKTTGSGGGGAANSMRNLWVSRSILKTRRQLPDILPWSEVVSQEHMEISPITNAIETISSKNVELSKLILSYSKEPNKPLSPLTMHLQGVLEASVNGGPSVIITAFFKTHALAFGSVRRAA